ncbi:hypothetical protein F4804DRAFT_328497, partial [Jackrogersella minutella]
MWSKLVAGHYTHVILGPEQATHKRVLKLLRNAEFNQKLALVAVDELHMVYQCREFREAYPILYK